MANKTTYKIDVKQKGAEKAKSSLTSLAKSAAGLAAAYMSVSKGMEFITESLELFKVQDLAVRRVEAALKSTKGVAGVTSTELQKLASSLQGVSTFGDEATLEMSALLLTFTNIKGPVLKDSIKMVQNMASAMGTDLKTQALMLGKALNDPVLGVSALSRVGVQLSATQKQQINDFAALGDSAAAQNVILQELATQFGGMAEAEMRSFAGSMTSMWNAIGDVQEVLGGKLAPALQSVANAVTNYLSVSPVDQLKAEQSEYNALMNIIQDTSVSTDTRTKAIKTLKEEYKDYLGNLDIEKATLEDIAAIQERSNEQMINDIIRKKFAAETEDIRNKIAEEQLKLYDAQIQKNELLGNSFQGLENQSGEYFVSYINNQGEAVVLESQALRNAKEQIATSTESIERLEKLLQLEEEKQRQFLETGEVISSQADAYEQYNGFNQQYLNDLPPIIEAKEKENALIKISAEVKKLENTYKEASNLADKEMTKGEKNKQSAMKGTNELVKAGILTEKQGWELGYNIVKAEAVAAVVRTMKSVAYPANILPSALQAAAGVAQIQQYAATKPKTAQYGFEGIVTDPTTFTVGEGGAAEYVSVTPLEGANNAAGGLVVNITGNVMSQDFVEGELAEKVQEAVRKGVSFA